MKKVLCFVVSILITSVFASGCSSLKDYPRYDQVLVYDRPFDYTYLKTLEALNTFPDWVLEETDKNKGLIVIRNTQYGHLFDRDKWVARFNIRRLDKRKTSVSLDPSSQRLEKGGELLNRIDEVVNISSNIEGVKPTSQAVS